MYRVLIICPSAGESSDTPCGADIYILARYLTENRDIKVDILSSRRDINTSDNLTLEYIPTYKDKWYKSVNDYQNSRNILEKIYKRIEVELRSKSVASHNIARYVMSLADLKKWIKQNNTRKYDLLISVSHPFYVHQYAKHINERMEIKKWCAYFLDPYADNSETKLSEIDKRVLEEADVFDKCSQIFAVNEFVNQAVHSKVREYIDKIVIVPTHPIVDKTHPCKKISRNKTTVHFVFTGMFYEKIRNPRELLELFKMLPSNYYLHLFSKGCNDIIEEYREVLGDRLITNGYITDHREFDNMIHTMDVLINVGNSISNQVPSKMLNYFSYGKLVINLKNCEDDPIEQNYSAFPLMKTVWYSADEKTATDIVEFCNDNIDSSVEWADIKSMFWTSTLEYLGQQISLVLQNEHHFTTYINN